ncbi:hypothetical protein HUJ05_012752 [Dendroctonus ponderosae]|nr:hypothetical protein HUJ05_012752 [Dendroctonus ponderosae]
MDSWLFHGFNIYNTVLTNTRLIASSIVPGGVVGGLGLGLGLASPGLTAKLLGLEGSGIEGQYVPDLTEKLYDDGSYKPGLHGL